MMFAPSLIYYADGTRVTCQSYQDIVDAPRTGVQIIFVTEGPGRGELVAYDWYLPFEDGTWAGGDNADLVGWHGYGHDLAGLKRGVWIAATRLGDIRIRVRKDKVDDGCKDC